MTAEGLMTMNDGAQHLMTSEGLMTMNDGAQHLMTARPLCTEAKAKVQGPNYYELREANYGPSKRGKLLRITASKDTTLPITDYRLLTADHRMSVSFINKIRYLSI
jgi:hypothetical protein